MCIKLVNYRDKHTKMPGQQNVKKKKIQLSLTKLSKQIDKVRVGQSAIYNIYAGSVLNIMNLKQCNYSKWSHQTLTDIQQKLTDKD